MKYCVAAALIMVFCLSAAGNPGGGSETVDAVFFYSKTCPHCAKEKPLLQSLEKEYEWLNVSYLDVALPENAQLYIRMAADAGGEAQAVPALFACGHMIVGYEDEGHSAEQVRRLILSCHEGESRFGGGGDHEKSDGLPAADFIFNASVDTRVNLPFFGVVEGSEMSLPLFTGLLGFIDGFNPCAFFILLFLLSLLIHAKSRSRMLLIGGVFVFFSGLVYFMFMAAWLNLFLYIGEIRWITVFAGLVALTVAALNIKDFFWFKKGVSLGISDSGKTSLFRRMRGLTKANGLASLVFGTVVLAVAANSYELLCTAGFPMVYTRVLTLNDLSPIQYYGYIAAYNVAYVTPLFFIVLAFTATLGSRKLGESEGRFLKLLSGVMMLFLGLLLVFSPDRLGSLSTASIIILLAVVTTALSWIAMSLRGGVD